MARKKGTRVRKKGAIPTESISPRTADEASRLYNLGGQLHQSGQLGQAESAYRQSLRLDPSFPGSYNNLGNVLMDQGKYRLAEKMYRQALQLAPDQPMLLSNIGNALCLQQSFREAEDVLGRAMQLGPRYVYAYINHGNVMMALRRSGEAIKSYLKALAIDDSVPELLGNLGMAYAEQDRYFQASEFLEKAIRLNPQEAVYHHKLGFVLSGMNMPDQAEGELSTASALAPEDPLVRFDYAFALVANGRLEAAKEQLRHAIRLDRKYTEAHYFLAKISRHCERDGDVRTMESLINHKGLSKAQQADLAFGLGKAYGDMRDYQKEFSWLAKAKSLAKQIADFDFDSATQIPREVIRFFSGDPALPYGDVGLPDTTPIIIVGMSRSGKSLVEKLLSLHPAVAARGETGIMDQLVSDFMATAGLSSYPEFFCDMEASSFAALGREYVSQLRANRLDQEHVTDTHPINANHIGLIRLCLPNAKIVLCRRSARDACISIYKKKYVNGHRYSNDLTDLGRFRLLHEQLLDLWCDLFPEAVHQVRFEALVESPEAEVGALLRFCDLPCDPAYMDKLRQLVREPGKWPTHENAIDVWKPYEKHLAPLFAALQEH